MSEKEITSAPAPFFEYEQNGESKRILMSFGLIDILAQQIGDIERLFQVGADFTLNDLIFRHVLTLDDKGRPQPKEYDAFTHAAGISLEDLQRMLAWVADHLTDFFIKSLGQTVSNLEKQKTKFIDIQQRGMDLRSSFAG